MTASTRFRLRVASAVLVTIGVACVALGLLAPQLGRASGPVRLSAGQQVKLPERPRFGGSVAVYVDSGTLTSAQMAEQLGCRVRSADGQEIVPAPLSGEGVAGLDHRVVDGYALLPVLIVTGGTNGGSITCSGPAATSSHLYLLSSSASQAMVPMAAFSTASLVLVLGVAGMVRLRPEKSA
jgi:hypothetical protein